MKPHSKNEQTNMVLLLFIIFASVIGFWLRFLISDPGYIFFGNSLYPIGNVEITNIFKTSFFIGYQPFAYGGYIPVGENGISVYLTNIINSSYLKFLAIFFKFNFAEKLYIITFDLFFGFAFWLLSSQIFKNKEASFISTLFILFNPFQLQLLSYGDTGQLQQLALLFISLFFFIRYLYSNEHYISTLSASIIFFFFVYPFNQAFYLGIILFLIATIYKIFFTDFKIRLFGTTKLLWIVYLFLIGLISLGIIWPFLHGGYNLLPTSKYAQPLSNFVSFSSSFLKVFLLEGYSPFVATQFVATSFGILAATAWNTLFKVILLFSLIIQWIARHKAGMYLSIVIILLSLFGSGSKSPLSFINIWLYLHFPGFQLLNASYYWDWILIAPIYAIELGFAYKIIIRKKYNENVKTINIRNLFSNRIHFANKIIKIFPYIFVMLLLLVFLTPISTQEYYSNNYIHTVSLPSDYYSLPSKLNVYNVDNYSGVAFFNPDNLLYLNNTNYGGFNSPYFNMIPFKTYGIPNYGAPPLNSSIYAYWAYDLFYHNETKYIGDLLSILGIKYFVVLYNANSESGYGSFMPWSDNINASHLMQYQKNIIKVYSSTNYSIYLNNYYTTNYLSISKLTLLLGNFNILNELATKGVDLSNLGIVFPWDIKLLERNNLMDYIGNIIFQPSQLNLSVSLDPDANELNLVGSTLPSVSDFESAWVPLDNVEGGNYVIFTLQNGIVTEGNHNLSLPFNVSKTGNYSILVQVYRNTNGGNLSIGVNNSVLSLATKGDNGTIWLKENVSLKEGTHSLKINSINGYNIIQSTYVVSSRQFEEFMNGLRDSNKVGNSSIFSINQLNISSTIPRGTPTNGSLEWDGFSIHTDKNITVFRNQYFSTFSMRNSNDNIIPVDGGINFIVISSGISNVFVNFYPNTFYILSYELPSLAMVAVSIVSLLDYRRRTK